MTHPLHTSVDDLITELKGVESHLITTPAVREIMNNVRLAPEAVKPYVFWSDERYTRNLIYKDNLFEVMAICWKPGQKTVIHTHNGQLGWMAIVQGEVSVHNYHYLTCNAPENQNVVGLDCLAGASHIELERLHTEHCHDRGHINTVDKIQSIHQIENEDTAKAGCVSLHVYSLPIDSCVAFDLGNQRCFRRTLSYYSRYGKVEIDVPHPTPPTTHLIKPAV